MSLVNILKPGVNLDGVMEGIVLNREDPTGKGRVGVFISRVMGLIANSSKEEKSKLITKDTSKNDDNNSISGTATISGINYLWAKRASRTGDEFGEWIIPPVGTSVFVFFLDGDPTQLYYLPFGPGDKSKMASSFNDNILHRTTNGSKIGFNFDDDKKDKFYVELSDGSGIVVDVNEKTVTVMTAKKAAKIELKDGEIKVVGDKVTVAGNEVYIKTPVGAQLWQPNIVPNCPLGGFPHGGTAGGVTDLKGGQYIPEKG